MVRVNNKRMHAIRIPRIISLLIVTLLCAEVTVSIIAPVLVDEGDGNVQVCAVLSSQEDTERDFDIVIATMDGTGA